MLLADARESLKELPKDLIIAQKLITNLSVNYTEPVAEAESTDYGAYIFSINQLSVRYRIAKITPTKTGQFVTLWKRAGNGPIQPFDSSDDIDLFIISVRSGEHFGQFIFPKNILQEKGILTTNNKEGKRAIRVYPPWDITNSKQAKKTQQWQIAYFLKMDAGQPIDYTRANQLYGQKK